MLKIALRHVRLLYSIAIPLCISSPSISAELGVTLQWDANPEAQVIGYRAYVGTESGNYEHVTDVGSNLFARVAPLDPGVTYYFAVSAYTMDGLESPLSDEISYTVIINGTNVVLTPLTITRMNGTSAVMASFNAKPGRRYFVQTSTDLRNWRTEQSFIFETSTGVAWQDLKGWLRPICFYRVVAQFP